MSEKTATDWKALRRAHEALWSAVAAVPAQAWDSALTLCDQWERRLWSLAGTRWATSWRTRRPLPAPRVRRRIRSHPRACSGRSRWTSWNRRWWLRLSAWAGVAEGEGRRATLLPQGDLLRRRSGSGAWRTWTPARHRLGHRHRHRPVLAADRRTGGRPDAGCSRHRRTAAGVRGLRCGDRARGKRRCQRRLAALPRSQPELDGVRHATYLSTGREVRLVPS